MKKLLEEWFQDRILNEIPAAIEVKKSSEKNGESCGLTAILERC
jgi:hypothetical protein